MSMQTIKQKNNNKQNKIKIIVVDEDYDANPEIYSKTYTLIINNTIVKQLLCF